MKLDEMGSRPNCEITLAHSSVHSSLKYKREEFKFKLAKFEATYHYSSSPDGMVWRKWLSFPSPKEKTACILEYGSVDNIRKSFESK